MTREIKFRAFDKKENKWWHDFRIHPFGAVAPAVTTIKDYWVYDSEYPQDDIELMQFTGLKDKNGKEIYESDILATESGNCEVVWFDEGACFRYKFNNKELESPLNYDNVEIICNIHENPDLLTT